MSLLEPVVPRRRNGKQQACEPCRKRKLACDHTFPICLRCQRRKIPASCVYHAAPMTKGFPGNESPIVNGNGIGNSQHTSPLTSPPVRRQTSSPSQLRSRPQSHPQSQVHSQRSSNSTTTTDQDPEEDPDQDEPSSLPLLNITSAFAEHRRSKSDRGKVPSDANENGRSDTNKLLSQTALFSNASGFLGPTSFSSVLLENCSRLDIDDDMEIPAIHEATLFDAHFIRLGTRVLSQLPDPHTCHRLSELQNITQDGWIQPGWEHCENSLWSTYGRYLAKPRKMADLEIVAKTLSKNTALPLAEPDDPHEWLESFSGKNLRWEALGILFTGWGYGAIASPEDSSLFQEQEGRRRERKEFTLEMKECAASCITLCSRTEVNNPLLVYLLYKHHLLESVCTGDTSSLVWRQHGDLISMTTALGLHRESDKTITKHTAASETRKRVFAGVFCIDKVMATFTGRPPGISRRYTSCSLPLDVSDEMLLAPEEELAKEVARLDPNGWNTDNEIYPATRLRMIMLFGFFRDEILEVSLGSPPENLEQALLDLKNRSTAAYDSLPHYLRYTPLSVHSPGPNSALLWSQLCGRLEHLQGHFLLERLMIKHNLTNGQAMLDIAKEMLGLVLVLWTHRDHFQGRQHDYEWMIMYYGVPPSGALCVELLKQTRDRSTSINTAGGPLRLSRSETIQQLSMFVGFLDWVKPAAPNSDLCFRIRGIISRVLDRILEGPTPSSSQPQVNFDSSSLPSSSAGQGLDTAGLNHQAINGAHLNGNSNTNGHVTRIMDIIDSNPTEDHDASLPHTNNNNVLDYTQALQQAAAVSSQAPLPLQYDFELPSDWIGIGLDEMSNFDLLDTFDWTRPSGWMG